MGLEAGEEGGGGQSDSPVLESGYRHLCLSSHSMFLRQGFRKYLPEVKKRKLVALQLPEQRDQSQVLERTTRGYVALASEVPQLPQRLSPPAPCRG